MLGAGLLRDRQDGGGLGTLKIVGMAHFKSLSFEAL